MSDAKPRRQTELSQLPLPFTNLSGGNALIVYTEHTDGWLPVYNYDLLSRLFKVYVTKLSSTICITVWVLKANTSKTEMKKTGRKIPPRNTIRSHFH